MNEIDDGAAFEAAVGNVLPDAAMLEDIEVGPEHQTDAAPDPRRRSDAQARIDAVTRARREAERERDYWRERASASSDGALPDDGREDVESRAASPMDPRSRGPAARDEREDDELFSDDGAFDPADVIAHLREKARAELLAEAAAFQAQESARGAAAVWEDRQAAFAHAQPDYVEAVMGADWACSEVMADAIHDSDAGPALAYHLASHPDQAAAIAAMSPLGQVRALGRIEAGLVEGFGQGTATTMSISAAPAPPPSLRGSGGRFRPAPDTDDFAAFDRAYGTR